MSVQRGFSLLETMLVVVIIGVFASSMLLPYTYGAKAQQDGNDRVLAMKLASDMLEYVLCHRFFDPDPSAAPYSPGPDSDIEASNRPFQFDNIDDFHGYTESEGQLRHLHGDAVDGEQYRYFSREVRCEYTSFLPPEPCSSDCLYILITVKVFKDGREYASLQKLMGR